MNKKLGRQLKTDERKRCQTYIITIDKAERHIVWDACICWADFGIKNDVKTKLRIK